VGRHVSTCCKDSLKAHCLRCSSADVCGECAANYTLYSPGPGSGQWCIPECHVDNCTQCADGDPYRCTQCPEGRYLDANSTCQLCSLAHCGTCSSGGSPCLSCATGYTFDSATAPTACAKCGYNCAVCTPGDPATCTKCNYPEVLLLAA